MSIEPIDADETVDDFLCRLYVELKGYGEMISYDLCLEIPDQEEINIAELYALRAGCEVAVQKLDMLIGKLDEEPDATEQTD